MPRKNLDAPARPAPSLKAGGEGFAAFATIYRMHAPQVYNPAGGQFKKATAANRCASAGYRNAWKTPNENEEEIENRNDFLEQNHMAQRYKLDIYIVDAKEIGAVFHSPWVTPIATMNVSAFVRVHEKLIQAATSTRLGGQTHRGGPPAARSLTRKEAPVPALPLAFVHTLLPRTRESGGVARLNAPVRPGQQPAPLNGQDESRNAHASDTPVFPVRLVCPLRRACVDRTPPIKAAPSACACVLVLGRGEREAAPGRAPPEVQRRLPPARGAAVIGQKTLMAFVAEECKRYTVYPPPNLVFTWTQMCDIHNVKVVILGQDLYHGPSQAHGLCFSVQRPVPPPPSLENIYKELETDIEDFSHPGHGDLTGWAGQGVLLFNAVLTVRAHQANSHKEKGWEQFTDAVVSWLNKNLDGLVFMLWGAYAQKKGSAIDRKRHHILQTVHPSPLSVHRGFFGCKHFSKTNELLQKSGKKPIDWKAL
ncbi:uncharacterized protein LOC132590867 [Heteronotia binoei]|uniref:uncharacterized protein LOC132590867 n=1 Tax=Heteronotia binoei TaxID=13085 RepID=UPI00292F4B33|nr:uncharacterized protein LOC132590867 [Heteronotia binoei]